MQKFLALTIALFSLAACANKDWVKMGAGQQDLSVDRYACMQDSMRTAPTKTAVQVVNGQLTSDDINYANRDMLFNACMQAKGWSWQQVQKNNP